MAKLEPATDAFATLCARLLGRQMAAALGILLQAAVIASVIIEEYGNPSGPELASAPNEGSYVLVRFAPRRPRMTSPTFLELTR
jgi:hypothetical protein